MLDCPCKLLIGRAFLGEFPETVLSQSPELLGKGWLAVEVNLKKIPPVRILACISHGGRTISTAFVLTESVGVDLVEDLADSAGKSLLLDGEHPRVPFLRQLRLQIIRQFREIEINVLIVVGETHEERALAAQLQFAD